MLLYLLVFIISLLFYKLSTITKYKGISKLFVLLGTLFLAIIGGLRDDTIGTDVLFYADKVFDDAVHSKSLIEYINNVAIRAEAGYAFLQYVVSIFSSNLNASLFVTQCLTFVFFVLAIYERKMEKHIVIVFIFFLLYFYNFSFNLIRQMMAINCCLYAFACFVNRKFLKSTLILLLGFSFHKTVLLAVLLFGICYFFSKSKFNYKWIILLIGVILLSLFVQRLDAVIESLAVVDVLSGYQYYTSDAKGTGSNYSELFIRFILFVWLFSARHYIPKVKFDFFIICLVIESVFFYLSFYSQYIYRMAFYLIALDVFFIPETLDAIKNRSRRILFTTSILLLLFCRWWWMYIYHDIHATVPYKSKILESILI